jgi:hypothetical protein
MHNAHMIKVLVVVLAASPFLSRRGGCRLRRRCVLLIGGLPLAAGVKPNPSSFPRTP